MAILAAAVLFFAAALLGRFVFHGPVDEQSLATSVAWWSLVELLT